MQSVGGSLQPCRRSVPSGLPPPPLLGCCRGKGAGGAALWRISTASSLYKLASVVSAGAPAVMKCGLRSLPLNMQGRVCTCQSDTVPALAKELKRLENDSITALIPANDKFMLMLLALTVVGFSPPRFLMWWRGQESRAARSPRPHVADLNKCSESRSGFVFQRRKSSQGLWGSESAKIHKISTWWRVSQEFLVLNNSSVPAWGINLKSPSALSFYLTRLEPHESISSTIFW